MSPIDSADTLWVKNFVEITLSLSVSKINGFLCLTQKFKMVAKSGRKTIFGKSWQWTLQIPCRSKISPKSLYLAPFRNKRVFVFNTEIQDGRQKWRENNFCEKLPAGQKVCWKLLLSRSVSAINAFLHFQH